jgi:hypothetical protein
VYLNQSISLGENISPTKQILSGGRFCDNDGLTGSRDKPEKWLLDLLNLDIYENFLPAILSRTFPPQGALLYYCAICQPLQFCTEVFKKTALNKLSYFSVPISPAMTS